MPMATNTLVSDFFRVLEERLKGFVLTHMEKPREIHFLSADVICGIPFSVSAAKLETGEWSILVRVNKSLMYKKGPDFEALVRDMIMECRKKGILR